MKRFVRLLFATVLGMLVAPFLQARDLMRVTPTGYRLGEAGEIVAERDSAVVKIAPADDVTAVFSNDVPVVFSARAGFGYRVVGWQKFANDPTIRLTTPETLETQDPASVEIAYSPETPWIYLVAVMELDDNRTLTLAKSPFGQGTIGTNYGTYACQKGDVFKLAAVPAHDDKTGFDYATFRRWSDGVTDYRRDVVVASNDTYVAEFVPNSWTVTFDPQGGTVVPASKTVTCDATYGRLPTPVRTGYWFEKWRTTESVDKGGEEISADTVVGALGDHTLFAQWVAKEFEISAQSKEGQTGNGTVSGAGRYGYGTEVKLTAEPASDSAFVGWDDGEMRNPRTVTVRSNATYLACFDLKTYRVTFKYRDAEGVWQMAPTNGVAYGTAAVPPSDEVVNQWSGHTFTGWSSEDYLKVTRDMSVEARYDEQLYKIRVETTGSGSGYVSGAGNYALGENVTLRANPDSGSAFVKWTDGVTAASRTFVATSNALYVAEFANVVTCAVRVETTGTGSGYVSGVGNYALGANVTLRATADTGSAFVKWGDGVTSPSRMFVITNDVFLTAEFTNACYQVVFTYRDAAGVLTNETAIAAYGAAAVPPEVPVWAGHTFTGWSSDDYLKVTRDLSVEARYDTELFTIKVQTTGDGRGTTTGTGNYPYGEEVTLEAKPDEGSAFVGWQDDASVGAKRELVVESNATYTAVFNPKTYTVTFIYTNGTKEAKDTQQVKYGNPATAPTDYEKTGYDFTGWSDTFDNVTSDKTIVALYNPITYWVKYARNYENKEGPYFEKQPPGQKYDTPFNLPADSWYDYSRDGYTLIGWSRESGDQEVYYPTNALVTNLTTVANSTNILYAQWQMKNSCRVTFDANGGKFEDGRTIWTNEVTKGACVNPLPEPTTSPKPGETKFNGWEKSDGTLFTTSTAVESDMKVVAKWDTEDEGSRFLRALGGNSNLLLNCFTFITNEYWSVKETYVACDEKEYGEFTISNKTEQTITINGRYQLPDSKSMSIRCNDDETPLENPFEKSCIGKSMIKFRANAIEGTGSVVSLVITNVIIQVANP